MAKMANKESRVVAHCPVCGAGVEGIDVEYGYMVETVSGTYGPGTLTNLKPRYEDKLEPFDDGDVITLRPCDDRFERREQRDWLNSLPPLPCGE